MIRAGYDPIGMLEFFTYMEGLERRRPQLEGNYFTIHPHAKDRIKNLRAHLETKGIKVPDEIYRLHLSLDMVCEAVDDHHECTIFVGDEPTFVIAGDDGDELSDRGFEVIHRLREAFNKGIRDRQVYSREHDGTHFLGTLGTILVSVTSDDERYLDGDAASINTNRKEKIKYILWKYYVESRI